MKVLVTGGSGFLGINLIRYLTRARARMRLARYGRVRLPRHEGQGHRHQGRHPHSKAMSKKRWRA